MEYYTIITEESQEDFYEAVRVALGPGHENISDEEADHMLGKLLETMSLEEQENFFRSLGRVAKSVGRTVVKALPTVLPVAGSVIGTAVGGPAGTAIGGALGNLAGGLAQRATQRRPRRVRRSRRPRQVRRSRRTMTRRPPTLPRRVQRRPPLVPRPVPLSTPPRSSPSGPPASQQLLNLIQNPQFLSGLIGQLLNRREAVDIQVQGESVQVPFGAFMNTLAHFAQEAAREASVHGNEAEPEYLMDAQGNYFIDPSSESERSRVLLEQLSADSEARIQALASDLYTEGEKVDGSFYDEDTLNEDEILYDEEYESSYYEEEEEMDPLTEWFLEQGMDDVEVEFE